MENGFFFLLFVLLILLVVLGAAVLAIVFGAVLLLSARGRPRPIHRAGAGVALLAAGLLPLLCLCIASLSTVPMFVTFLSAAPQSIDINSDEVQDMLAARLEAGAEDKGFTPVDPTAQVRIERAFGDDRNYDVMLHIYGLTSRTIAFQEDDGEYQWIGEQETFTGPNRFPIDSGYSNEQITITFDTVYISGAPLNTLYVTYLGDDTRLVGKWNLTLEDVRPVLLEWRAIQDR